ncbi:protein phosphatase, Mg2+/Mn2+ dependent, 1Na (putative) [Megalops cyprinoides]|uniref:protein phosphatase, Mg2+/Mn2+ dependent, 1Na (putative) n=1 Tax=Megalops cyprinoides TaxID=118141 RepID=UPI001863E30C|nr:protein phosphatase, Mg2+/Mn2+ dependent, 1Na (putative) [Megalops cyprinoides]
MRTARRASNVEVPSFLRQLVKETGKMVTFFFKGEKAEGVSNGMEDDEDDDMPSPYLERPILEKHTAEGEAKWGSNYALASMQGWRAQMEDAHTCTPEIDGDLSDWGYFAVFDGHAGSTVAQYCSRNLLDHILATGMVKAEEDKEDVMEGIREGFLRIDKHMHTLSRQENWDRSGSTAAAVMISPHHIYFINCGDSRTLLCRGGRVCFYTEDHKPINPRERERIQNAGGSVTLQRVNGSLAVSRALGDFTFKEVEWRPQTEQLVSPEPEVYELERTPEDEFLVLACDGVWDAMSNEDLCAFVHSRLQVCDDLREVCTQVIDLCLYKGSVDNISIIIICFPGAPKMSQEALQQEAEMEELLEAKVAEAFRMMRSRDEEPDLLFVMKFLASESIPGLPPGGGVTSKRDCIIAAYQKLVATYTPQEPTDIGGSEDSS